MKFLYELTQEGHVREANKLGIFQALGGLFKSKNPMEKMGLGIAHEVLKNEGDFGRSAAILMLIGLDSAYNAVLAVSSHHHYKPQCSLIVTQLTVYSSLPSWITS